MWKTACCLFILCSVFNAVTLAKPPYSGGETTVFIANKNAYSKPANNLSITRREHFFIGNSFFKNPWVTAPSSTTARDGLGPLFNTNGCQSCHVKDGRGRPPEKNEVMTSMLVRLGKRNEGDETGTDNIPSGIYPDPVYGNQIQNRAVPGLQPEANIILSWKPHTITFAEKDNLQLRVPDIKLTQLSHGPLHVKTELSARTAPAMIGMGLLEAVPVESLQKIATAQVQKNDGVSGRLNMVWDIELQKLMPGRFGWKAGQPTVRQQVASAFAGDIGITSSLFPNQPCTDQQHKCSQLPSGGSPEVSDEILDFVTFYSKTLAVPARRNVEDKDVQMGERIFRDIGCATCHVETLITGIDTNFPELSEQEIHPYTDLLLHDMGEGLADHTGEFLANGREWRTPPLWGIGLMQTVNGHTNLLHDGRARSVEEAILWHGGEANHSRNRYIEIDKLRRNQLIKFINSL